MGCNRAVPVVFLSRLFSTEIPWSVAFRPAFPVFTCLHRSSHVKYCPKRLQKFMSFLAKSLRLKTSTFAPIVRGLLFSGCHGGEPWEGNQCAAKESGRPKYQNSLHRPWLCLSSLAALPWLLECWTGSRGCGARQCRARWCAMLRRRAEPSHFVPDV